MHWSNYKEPKQAKSKDEVIRRNLDRICISATPPLPSNPSKHSQVNLILKKIKRKKKKHTKSNNSRCQTMPLMVVEQRQLTQRIFHSTAFHRISTHSTARSCHSRFHIISSGSSFINIHATPNTTSSFFRENNN